MEATSRTVDDGGMTNRTNIPRIDLDGVAFRLEALRTALNLEKADFAVSGGIDPSSYSKMLNRTKPLKSDHAFALATTWGVTMDFFYRGDLSRIEEPLRTKIRIALNGVDK